MSDASAYEREPYRTELETEVISVGEVEGRPFALLADTILYPEGGGQPADRGRLNDIPVLDMRRTEDGILHLLEAPASAGPATLELDWARRYDHMQQHTAQHLLSAVAAELHGWTTTSFHLGAEQCDIELDTETVAGEALAALEERVVELVRADLPVTARRVPPETFRTMGIRTRGLPETHAGDVRLVEIERIDVTTCGGTHLRSTAEIETIKLGASEPMRGGTRLYWRAGNRVRRRLGELEVRNRELRLLFETGGDELVAVARSRLDSLRETSRALRRASAALAEARADALALDSSRFVEADFQNVDAGFLQRLARRLVEAAPDKTVLLTASGDSGLLFLLAAGAESEVDVAQLGPRIAAALGGRGGGSGALFQGKAPSADRRLDAVRLLTEPATDNG